MIEIDGLSLPALPIVDLERVRDLENYEGPLLSHFRHRRQGDHYLYYWCDCDDAVNRWMLLRVNETNIIRLVNRFVPLDYVIPRACQDDFVYFIDIGGEDAPAKVILASLDAIPDAYIPAQGAYLEAEAAKDDSNPQTYSILIERDLSIRDLSDLPRIFSQAYALLYNLLILKPQKWEGYPWRGGFSAMHFYRWLLDRLPGEDYPAIETFQYASPGFIRLSLNQEIASRVADLVFRMTGDDVDIHRAYNDLVSYIRTKKLNELSDTNDPTWDDCNSDLRRLTRILLTALGIQEPEELIEAVPRPFEAAKITLSFVGRLKQLAKLDASGAVRFPATAGSNG